MFVPRYSSIYRLFNSVLNGMSKAASTTLEGFICPACLVDFPSPSKLQGHWLKFHSPNVRTNTAERVSNDYEDIPDDSPSNHTPQVCAFVA